MLRPYFSVLMSVYNHQDYVEEAIASVQAQTWADWELIVINDGSTDRSVGIIDRLATRDARLLVIHQANAGLAAARNKAASYARADWLTYLDSDDVWLPDALADYHEYLGRSPQAQWIYGFAHRLREEAITLLPGESQDRATGTAELFQRVFLNPMCVCHRRELWHEVGGFDPALRYCDDYDFFLRASLHCRFEPLGKAIGLRRRHGRNMSQKSGKSQKTEALVLSRFAEQFGHEAGLSQEVVSRRLGRLYVRAARQFLREGDYRQALEMIDAAKSHGLPWKGRLVGWASRLLLPFGRKAG